MNVFWGWHRFVVVSVVKKIVVSAVFVAVILFMYEVLIVPGLELAQGARPDRAIDRKTVSTSSVGLFIEPEPFDVSLLSFDQLNQLTYNDHQESQYITNGVRRAVTYKDHAITHLQFSPHKERLGFFYYPYDNSVTDIALAVMDISLGTVRDIYQDSVRTSRWEWKD